MCFASMVRRKCGHESLSYDLCCTALYLRYSYEQVRECFQKNSSSEKLNIQVKDEFCYQSNFCEYYTLGTPCKFNLLESPAHLPLPISQEHPPVQCPSSPMKPHSLVRINWRDYIGHTFLELGDHGDPSLAAHYYDDRDGDETARWKYHSFKADMANRNACVYRKESDGKMGRPNREGGFTNYFPPPAQSEEESFRITDLQRHNLPTVRNNWANFAGGMPKGMSLDWARYKYDLEGNLKGKQDRFRSGVSASN